MPGLSSKRRWIEGSNSFRSIYFYLLDLLFPSHCVECHSAGRSICGKCYPLIEWIEAPFCRLCGQPLGKIDHHQCVDPQLLRFVRSAAVFSGPMRRAIHALKYSSDRVLALFLVDISFPHFSTLSLDFDRILPVPLGRIRERERGYNQSVLLAEALSIKAHIPVDAKCLSRSRETRSQVGLSHAERRINVERAFSASSVSGCKILLVDDVCTTGATLQSCAAALMGAGAHSVAGLTLARAILPGMDLHPDPHGEKK